MGESKNPLGICEPVPEPQSPYYLYLETPGHRKKQQESFHAFPKDYFWNINISKTHFCQVSKRRAPTNDEGPLNKILKILDMGSISINKHEIEIW